MAQETFNYEPLQPRQIRVLEVEPPTDPSTPISCICTLISLEDSSYPSYTAVSYTWGSDEKPHHLLINGRLLPITQTVHDIFRSKLMTSCNSPLWIDAVCINQNDIEEKALQVGMMGEIYSYAERVRVWLGPEAEDSRLAIGFTKTVASVLPELENGDVERIKYYAAKYPEEAPEWGAFAKLLDRPWFTRTWVIQEVALASRAEVICGDDSVDWETLARVVNGSIALGFNGMIAASPDAHLLNIRGLSGLERVYKLSSVCNFRQQGKEIPLFDLMVLFSHSKTIDPRDKVYGLLGVATDVDDIVFAPNYTRPPVALFTEVTRFVIKRESRLGFLRWAGVEDESAGVGASFPSWAFSFSDKLRPRCLGNYPVMPSTKPEISFSARDNELRTKGIIFDSIVRLGSTSAIVGDGHPPGRREIANIYTWYLEAKEIFQSTGTQDEQVFWRTIVGNKIDEDNNANLDEIEEAPGPEYGEFCEAFERIAGQFEGLRASDTKAANYLFLNEDGSKALKFRQALTSAISSRHFCVLKGGSVGLVPNETRSGDLVAALLGAMVLFIIRPLPKETQAGDQRYQLVGECYIHDRMNGQVMGLDLDIQDIVLV